MCMYVYVCAHARLSYDDVIYLSTAFKGLAAQGEGTGALVVSSVEVIGNRPLAIVSLQYEHGGDRPLAIASPASSGASLAG